MSYEEKKAAFLDGIRAELANDVASLPLNQQSVFKLMYGRNGGKRPVNESIAMDLQDVAKEIPEAMLSFAVKQVSRGKEALK